MYNINYYLNIKSINFFSDTINPKKVDKLNVYCTIESVE